MPSVSKVQKVHALFYKSACTFTIVRALYQISVLRFPKYSTNVTTIKINGKFPWSIIFNIEYFKMKILNHVL